MDDRSILIIAYYYPPENTIGAARPFRFARYLGRARVQATVIANNAQPDWAEQANVIRTPSVGHPASAVVRRISALMRFIQGALLPCDDRLGWVPHAVAAGAKSLAANPDQILFSTHPPIATHLVALLLKRRFNVPWVADFRDPLWGNPLRLGRRSSLLDPLIERIVFHKADAVIANTDAVAALWRARYPGYANKIHTIWNGFDLEDVMTPLPPANRTRKIISHIGTLYGDRTPEPLVRSLNRLLDAGVLTKDGFDLRLIGVVDPTVRLDTAPFDQLLETGCLKITPRAIPQVEARTEMLSADYLVLLDMVARYTGLQVPAKLFEYVRACRPVIAFSPPDSPTRRVLLASGIPHVAIDPVADGATIDAALTEFFRSPVTAFEPSHAFWKQFDARRQTDALMRIFEGVSGVALKAPAANEPALDCVTQ